MNAPTSGKVGAAVWDGYRTIEHSTINRNPLCTRVEQLALLEGPEQ